MKKFVGGMALVLIIMVLQSNPNLMLEALADFNSACYIFGAMLVGGLATWGLLS
jgi:hypothetical protein